VRILCCVSDPSPDYIATHVSSEQDGNHLVIDLHIHLLPGVDDGPETVDQATGMLDRAAALGFTRIVCTPHLDGPLGRAFQALVEERLDTMRPIAAGRGITLDAGFEIRLSPGTAHQLAEGEPSTMAGSRTALVELPFSGWPLYTDSALFELMAAGFRPLLAHPERYRAVQDDLDLAVALAERGVLMQLTLRSLTGLFGKEARRVSEALLRRDLATVLATDAHSGGQRFVSTGAGIARARELVGEERTRQLVHDNAEALLDDRELPPSAMGETGEPAARVGWAKRLLARG
jgi:protein-tyrosine phosphatase